MTHPLEGAARAKMTEVFEKQVEMIGLNCKVRILGIQSRISYLRMMLSLNMGNTDHLLEICGCHTPERRAVGNRVKGIVARG